MNTGSLSDAKNLIQEGAVTHISKGEHIKLERDEKTKDLNIKVGDFIKVGESFIQVVKDKK